VKCPKCNADVTKTHERTPGTNDIHYENGTPRPPTIDEILGDRGVRIFGTEFDVLFTCATDGEFGVRADGSAEFAEPDTWIEGPTGEKLFRM